MAFGAASPPYYNVQEVTLTAGQERQLDYDFIPDQVLIVPKLDSVITDNIEIVAIGAQGGGKHQLRGTGPLVLPGITKQLYLRNNDLLSRTLIVTAQKGYAPLSIVMPTTSVTLGVAAVESPLAIAQCKVWHDAGQGLAGLSDGDAVASWTDMSGNANHSAQGTAGQRPLYKTGIVNTLPVLRFDGVDDLLVGVYALALPWSIFLVCAWRGAGGTGIQNALGIASTSGALYKSSITQWSYYDGGAVLAGPTAIAGRFVLLEAIHEIALSRFYYNSALQASGSFSPSGGVAGLGARPVAEFDYGDVDIAEVIIYSAALVDDQRSSLQEYLRAKYNLWT